MMLPFTFWWDRIGGLLEPELLNLDALIASKDVAIDIGANIGLYTYAFAKRFRRVYAFEINDEITGLISNYGFGNVELIQCGLSSETREASFYVPVAGGFALAGWGSLNRNNLPGAERVVEKKVSLKPLDDFDIPGVSFIKIDVEGHEVEVLQGAAKTINNFRPIVLAELKSENVGTVDARFMTLNYKHFRLEDFVNAHGSEANHIFVPVERLAELNMAGRRH